MLKIAALKDEVATFNNTNQNLNGEIITLKDAIATYNYANQDLIKKNDKLKNELSRYNTIINIENEISKLRQNKLKIEIEIKELSKKHSESHNLYLALKHENELYTESLDLSEYGVYQPHFDFDTSEEYKEGINTERELQRSLIKEGDAVFGGDTIKWNGSLALGQTMVKREKKLMLRAFNGECDSFISSVEWNNVLKMEERIEKSFEAINSAYKDQGIYIYL